jgi:hypothetical protein
MTNDNPKSGADTPEQGDSLSATGMFLRAFNAEPKPDTVASDPFASTPAVAPSAPPAQRPPAQPQSGGEFTQLFQKVDARQPSASGSPLPAETPVRPMAPAVQPQPPQSGNHGVDRGPGEFTRVFVGGATPTPPASPKSTDEYSRSIPLPTGNSPRSKGFSEPGGSGSASGEGSFTQIFKSASSIPASSPAAPPQAAAPPPIQKSAWNDDPIFRAPQSPPPADPSSPSVTTLLASLGTSGNANPAARSQGNAAYRPEPILSALPFGSREPQEAAPGGVTRMIQRLAQTPPEPVLASPPVAPPPVSSGPGDFTRMISRMGPSSPAVEPPPPTAQGSAPAPTPFAPPPVPAVAPPPIPLAPKMAPPQAPAAHLPAIPKPPVSAPPALAAPKTKLEAMVPILLVINTFLLLVLLIVVIFLIKSR